MPPNQLSDSDPDAEFRQRAFDGEERAVARATTIGKFAVWPWFFGTLLGVGLSVWGVVVYHSENEVYFKPFFCITLGYWGILMVIQMFMLDEAHDRTGTHSVWSVRRNLIIYGVWFIGCLVTICSLLAIWRSKELFDNGHSNKFAYALMIVQLVFSVIPNMICLALYVKYLSLLRPLHFHIVDKTPGRTSSKSSGRSARSKLSRRSEWSRQDSGRLSKKKEKDDYTAARPTPPPSPPPQHQLPPFPSNSQHWPHQQQPSDSTISTDSTYSSSSKSTSNYEDRVRQPYPFSSTPSNRNSTVLNQPSPYPTFPDRSPAPIPHTLPFSTYHAPPQASYGHLQSCYHPPSSAPGSHGPPADIPVVVETGTSNPSVIKRETWDPERQRYLPDGGSSASTSRPTSASTSRPRSTYAAYGSAWSAASPPAPAASAHGYIAYSPGASLSPSSSLSHPSRSSSPTPYHPSTSPSTLGSSSIYPAAQRASPYRVPSQSAPYGQGPLSEPPLTSQTPPPSASTLARSSARSSAYRYPPGQQTRPVSPASSAPSSYRTTTTPQPTRPSSSSSHKRDSGISFGRPHSPLKVMNPDVPKRKPVAAAGGGGGHVNPDDQLLPMPEWDGHRR
ncbi:hypothetical protein JCM1840_001612 [Sporobolomyces johnsonii]